MHLRDLRIVGGPTAATNPNQSFGIYSNAGDDITVDYCEVDGFQMNLVLINGATHVRLYHNFIANAWTPSLATMSCSGLYTECVSPDVECNVFYHNGWSTTAWTPAMTADAISGHPSDAAAALTQAMIFRHGWYENPGSNAVGGTDKFNLYLRNACTGHQCRAGGSNTQWCIFWDNGNACDVLTTGGAAGSQGGEIGHCLFLGNLTHDYVCWGGGIVGQSAADNVHDCLFAGDSRSMQGAAPYTVAAANGVNGTQSPALPADATASITRCRGVWPNAEISQLNGRSATQTSVSIRPPKSCERLPTLLDFLGTPDDAATAALLRKNLHNARYSAQVVIGWASRMVPD